MQAKIELCDENLTATIVKITIIQNIQNSFLYIFNNLNFDNCGRNVLCYTTNGVFLGPRGPLVLPLIDEKSGYMPYESS